MRVLHFGNVAQNGYNNAKFLRRIGVDAAAICDEEQALAQPEWEDARLPEGVDGMAQWTNVATEWQRPEWVIAPRRPPARPRGFYRLAYAAALGRSRPRLRRLYRELLREYAPIRAELGSDLRFDDVRAGFRAAWMHSIVLGDVRGLFGGYDLVQAYATHPTITLVAAPEHPFVAFEHGTLRELPFEDSWRGRLLTVAYRRAARVVITNADVIASARRLGLENVTFIPHPIDETKYTPGASEFGARIRREGRDFVAVAPARQDWRDKRNDLALRGFAEFARTTSSRPLLVLGEWGFDVERSRALVSELGIGSQVEWVRPLPKLQLIDLYRGADVVLDQFALGTFGTTAPEAMSCGRPVVMAFERSLHEWCFPVQPPIVDARSERDIGNALERLARDPAERARLGAVGRDWVAQHHGWRLVADRHRSMYEAILGVTAARRKS